MILAGLDLATSSGFCFGRPDAVPTVQVVRAPVTGEELGPWAAFYWRAFQILLVGLVAMRVGGERIVINYEAPILPEPKWDPVSKKRTGGTNLATTRKLHSMGAMLEAQVYAWREQDVTIEVFECHLQSIKKELAGKGDATKADMVFVARKAGILLPEGKGAEDGADAFGAWYLALRHKAPEHLGQWDQRIYGGLFRR